MEDREAVAEAGAEAGDGLRGEADLGDEDDRAAAAGERRLDRGEVDLGLAGAGDAVEELLARARRPRRRARRRGRRPRPAARGGGCGALDRGGEAGARRGRGARANRGWRSGRGSASRRRVARSEPTAAASSGADISPRATSASSTARCFTPSRSPPSSAASPGRQDLGPQLESWRARCGRRAPVPVPGGSTSERPREGVEQYSRATQRPSSTSSGGAPASSASIGSASRSGGSSEDSASSTTTPSSRRGPNGTRTSAADLEPLHRLRAAVVERPPQRAGGRQRLDLEDRHRRPRLCDGRGRRARRGASDRPRRRAALMLARVGMNLSAGEQIIFQGHPSWRAILGFYLKGVVVAVVLGDDRRSCVVRARRRLPRRPRGPRR